MTNIKRFIKFTGMALVGVALATGIVGKITSTKVYASDEIRVTINGKPVDNHKLERSPSGVIYLRPVASGAWIDPRFPKEEEFKNKHDKGEYHDDFKKVGIGGYANPIATIYEPRKTSGIPLGGEFSLTIPSGEGKRVVYITDPKVKTYKVKNLTTGQVTVKNKKVQDKIGISGIPVRVAAEELGYKLNWNNKTKTVELTGTKVEPQMSKKDSTEFDLILEDRLYAPGSREIVTKAVAEVHRLHDPKSIPVPKHYDLMLEIEKHTRILDLAYSAREYDMAELKKPSIYTTYSSVGAIGHDGLTREQYVKQSAIKDYEQRGLIWVEGSEIIYHKNK